MQLIWPIVGNNPDPGGTAIVVFWAIAGNASSEAKMWTVPDLGKEMLLIVRLAFVVNHITVLVEEHVILVEPVV